MNISALDSKIVSRIYLICTIMMLFSCAKAGNPETSAPAISGDGVYELRTYTTHPEKLEDLHQRFQNHTMTFFEKHGMENIGYWSPEGEELKDNTLIYLLAHQSREAAELSWASFIADPEWQQVYEASREEGPIVQHIESIFMRSTHYSP